LSIRFDFLESGIGETILITFPNGQVGIIDAHPSFDGRVRAVDFLRNKEIAFVCLSHPHEDHGKGLIEIVNSHPSVSSFWHTVSGIQSWVYSLEDSPVFPSHIRQTASDYMRDSGNFLRELFGGVARKGLVVKTLHSGLAAIEVGDVRIHVLAPEESQLNEFQRAYLDISAGKRRHIPDPNIQSSILAIEYGKKVALLGGDSLKKSWVTATTQFRKLKLDKGCLIKIPHHGASNAFDLQANESATYLGICEKDAIAVLFAGDTKHPDKRVEMRIKGKLRLHCLVNGANQTSPPDRINPLGLKIPGARIAKLRIPPCQTEFSVEIRGDGQVQIITGIPCTACQYGST
jgi:hypothetical protein